MRTTPNITQERSQRSLGRAVQFNVKRLAMTQPRRLNCSVHGWQDECFVCQHIVESLSSGDPVGFHWSGNSKLLRPDAWCTSCERARVAAVAMCVAVGGLLAAFTPAKWFAASLWVSAALYINGSLAQAEDARPGGFDNPEGSDTPPFAKGIGAIKFALQSLAITVVLAALGFYIQFK